ncbi:GNAT family N-acetyltransferase [Roseibium sediminis]|uniref:GNAT family N-acetyltransferase n=1 Tax=Roseibium sediminis TaxID=1775174 RepID=UPI001FCCA009|nr:GNAT family N-acetyltransferase [Roseibium sediminis]
MDDRFECLWLTYDEMTKDQLHDLLKLRQDIFVVEQESPYADIDGKDRLAMHLFVVDRQDGKLVGAIRLFSGNPARIGRVVVHRDFRRFGLGKVLMANGVEKARSMCPGCDIDISAQSYLDKFYSGFGFLKISEEYLEDGIPHIDMKLSAAAV